jgi:hypothetical protein
LIEVPTRRVDGGYLDGSAQRIGRTRRMTWLTSDMRRSFRRADHHNVDVEPFEDQARLDIQESVALKRCLHRPAIAPAPEIRLRATCRAGFAAAGIRPA